MMKPLNLGQYVQKYFFINIHENVLRLTKYLRKFHTFLWVKEETLQSWYSRSLQIFYQSLHNIVMRQ